MQGWSRLTLALATAAALFVSLAEPAEARRRFRFGLIPSFSSGTSWAEKIEKVYDLPDTGTYFHDGNYYDLGSFYTVRDGAEERSATPVFVLYHGDRYVRLDESQLAAIRADLGMDPTAAYTVQYTTKYAAPRSPSQIDRLPGETDAQLRDRVRAMAQASGRRDVADDPDPVAAMGGGMGGTLIGLLMIGAIIIGLRRMVRRMRAEVDGSASSAHDRARTQSFEQRVAERMRELQSEPAPAAAAAAPVPIDRTAGITTPGVRTFGRRTM